MCLKDPSQCTYPKVLQTEEATAKWCEWEMNKEEDASIFWMLHDNALLIRVQIKMSLNFRTTTVRQNRADALLKTIKKADGQTVADEAAKLALDMNKIGGVDIDFMSEGRSQMKGGSMPTDAFSDLNSSLADVRVLAGMPKEKKKGDDGEGDGGDDDSDNSDEEGKPKGKKKKRGDASWWARDEYIVSKETEIESAVDTEVTKLEDSLALLKKRYEAARAVDVGCWRDVC